MTKTTQNYIFIGLGAAVIILVLALHYLEAIADLVCNYNDLVDYVNRAYKRDFDEYNLYFFGIRRNNINLLVDMVLAIIIILISVMIFLKIYWSIKEK